MRTRISRSIGILRLRYVLSVWADKSTGFHNCWFVSRLKRCCFSAPRSNLPACWTNRVLQTVDTHDWSTQDPFVNFSSSYVFLFLSTNSAWPVRNFLPVCQGHMVMLAVYIPAGISLLLGNRSKIRVQSQSFCKQFTTTLLISVTQKPSAVFR